MQHLPHVGQLPMLLHYVCLDSQVHGFGRAKSWADTVCWNGSKVAFWTESEVYHIMNTEERAIYDHYALPTQKLYYASYIVLCAFGGLFLHPHYVPHTLLWSKIAQAWDAQSSQCTALLAHRAPRTPSCGPCQFWNGFLCAVPKSPAMQYLKQLAAPRYLTPVSTPDDAEFTAGCYLLEQLDKHTLTTSAVGYVSDSAVRDMAQFVPFHNASSTRSTCIGSSALAYSNCGQAVKPRFWAC